MIRLQVQPLDTPADVEAALQKAIQLELATLPPYLYALYTLRPGTNEPARARISAIVREEMTHMALAANILRRISAYKPPAAPPEAAGAASAPVPATAD